MNKNLPLFLWAVLQSSILVSIQAQAVDTTFKKYLPSENGLDHRSFLYVGERDTRHPEAQMIFLVRNGKVVWDYSIPLHPAPGANQEFDDISMLPNRNIVFARMSGAGDTIQPVGYNKNTNVDRDIFLTALKELNSSVNLKGFMDASANMLSNRR
jgi:hypothetical protein